MRNLAPIPNAENVIALLQKAKDDGQFFEYRMSIKGRKHLAVDMQSVNAILVVADALGEKNKAKYLAHAPNVGHMAMIAWELIGKSKH